MRFLPALTRAPTVPRPRAMEVRPAKVLAMAIQGELGRARVVTAALHPTVVGMTEIAHFGKNFSLS